MWKCHKCGKPVYFAERKQSLGYDWHPECLRCEECSKRLNPGQHAEHKGVPYCHVPCYGALFGPQLFGHGTRVESHTSFGRVENRGGPATPRSHLESKLKLFNQFHDGNSGEIRSREVNGRLVLEGALRIHWGVLGLIHLKEDDDQRTVITVRKRNSYRSGMFADLDLEDVSDNASSTVDSGVASADPSVDDTSSSASTTDLDTASCRSEGVASEASCQRSATLPHKLEARRPGGWDELDDLLQVERVVDETDKLYQTMPTGLPSVMNHTAGEYPLAHAGATDANLNKAATDLDMAANTANGNVTQESLPGRDAVMAEKLVDNATADPDSDDSTIEYDDNSDPGGGELGGAVIRRAPKTGSTAIRRRPGKRRSRTALRRRCSINGHFYDRETSIFTPPRGSTTSVWVSSLVSTQEVINLLLDKYKVDSRPNNFALFVVRDNGEQRRLRDDEYPLLTRVMLGPHEDVAKLYIMDARGTEEITSEVAQFLNLSSTECRAILDRYRLEEDREAKRVRAKFREMRKRIKQRMEDLKVRL